MLCFDAQGCVVRVCILCACSARAAAGERRVLVQSTTQNFAQLLGYDNGLGKHAPGTDSFPDKRPMSRAMYT
eukprot:4000042-Pyramimonas_sp.AAC.1